MYGLVNRGVQQLVESQFGAAAWVEICAKAGVNPAGFVAMESYDDAVTYRLVGALCAHTGLTAAEALETYGAYWVRYTATQGYGPLMSSAGRTLPEFLSNLDAMHSRMSATFPDFQPPSFQVEVLGPNLLRLHYWTHREGLAPMVVGLVKGLAERFGTTVEITMDRRREDGADHDELLIHHGG
jgi:hypothetical protein